jgi:hypothetical protein
MQQRDPHPAPGAERSKADVPGLVKYVAGRDKASEPAELFGDDASLGTEGRKDFVAFVKRSVDDSQPQVVRTRSGRQIDRRRAVYRVLISPQVATGLDLQGLARVAVDRLEVDMGVSGLRWIAAIHRNTDHHHIHLVLAGMHEVAPGRYHRVDISRRRLAAVKEAIGLEIDRQRDERMPEGSRLNPASEANRSTQEPALVRMGSRAAVRLIRERPVSTSARRQMRGRAPLDSWRSAAGSSSLSTLRAVARRYSRQMQRDLELEARRSGLDGAA